MRFSKQRHPARMLLVGGMMAILGALLLAPTAMASSHNPKGEFKEFGECPLNTPAVEECVFSVTNGGSFVVGKKTVPLVNPVTLQGGLAPGEGGEALFVAAENGDHPLENAAAGTGRTARDHRTDLVAEIPPGLVQRPDQQRVHRGHRDGRTGRPGEQNQNQHRKPDQPGRNRARAADQGQARQRDPR